MPTDDVPITDEHDPPEALVRALVERVWNGQDLDALGDFYAPSFEHDGGTGTLDDLRAWHEEEHRTWADVAYEVRDLVADAEQVAVRWTSRATLVGRFGPVSGTGQQVESRGAHFFRVEDGRIASVHSMSDVFSKAIQLGVQFSPPAADDPAG